MLLILIWMGHESHRKVPMIDMEWSGSLHTGLHDAGYWSLNWATAKEKLMSFSTQFHRVLQWFVLKILSEQCRKSHHWDGHGYAITHHWNLWDMITYPWLRYLLWWFSQLSSVMNCYFTFCYNSTPGHEIITNFCTCHDSSAVMACEKCCDD